MCDLSWSQNNSHRTDEFIYLNRVLHKLRLTHAQFVSSLVIGFWSTWQSLNLSKQGQGYPPFKQSAEEVKMAGFSAVTLHSFWFMIFPHSFTTVHVY